jgi:hypothetical protein
MCQAMYEYQVTRELDEDYDEDEIVCIYCGEPKGDSLGCCGENHWTTAKEML